MNMPRKKRETCIYIVSCLVNLTLEKVTHGGKQTTYKTERYIHNIFRMRIEMFSYQNQTLVRKTCDKFDEMAPSH